MYPHHITGCTYISSIKNKTMATALEQIADLESKIGAAQTRIDEINGAIPGVQNSLSGPGNGCLIATPTGQPNIQGTPWVKNTPVPNFMTGGGLCQSYWKTMDLWDAELTTLKANITTWNNQINLLKKDPSVVIALNDAAAALQRKKIWTYGIVAVIIIAALVFVWYKWIRK